jgi:hypothetical protein
MVERNQSASEHSTERERTSSVAIVATRIQMSGDTTLAQTTGLLLGGMKLRWSASRAMFRFSCSGVRGVALGS